MGREIVRQDGQGPNWDDIHPSGTRARFAMWGRDASVRPLMAISLHFERAMCLRLVDMSNQIQ